MSLVAKGIWKTLGKHQVLRAVDAEVHPGEITVVLGPSGGGKTTLVRALALLDPPSKGTIVVDDRHYVFPSSSAQIAPPWPDVTVVFQQLFLWPHLSLRQNILLPLKRRGFDGDGYMSYMNGLVDVFDMGEFIDRYPNQVSLGQRQRAALLRALVLRPKYVLLDEITSALDVEQVARLLAELRLLRERGIGILLISHLLEFAKSAGDRFIFLEDGAVVEQGDASQLRAPRTERVAQFLSLIEAAR